MSDDDHDPLAVTGERLPAGFDRRTVTIEPGAERAYDPAEWWDSLVMVGQGEVDLECDTGRVATFRRGDILWLTGLPLCALHNRGTEPAVLVAVSRRVV